MTPGNSCLAAA